MSPRDTRPDTPEDPFRDPNRDIELGNTSAPTTTRDTSRGDTRQVTDGSRGQSAGAESHEDTQPAARSGINLSLDEASRIPLRAHEKSRGSAWEWFTRWGKDSKKYYKSLLDESLRNRALRNDKTLINDIRSSDASDAQKIKMYEELLANSFERSHNHDMDSRAAWWHYSGTAIVAGFGTGYFGSTMLLPLLPSQS